MRAAYKGFGDIIRQPAKGDEFELRFPNSIAFEQGIIDLIDSLKGTHTYRGVHTFFANVLRKLVKPVTEGIGNRGFESVSAEHRPIVESFRFLLARRMAGRYQDYVTRKEYLGSEIPAHVIAVSQGVPHVMRWRGIPLFKTVFDISLYSMMLWDLKPRTIIETGSGSGGSAVWLADLLEAFKVDTHIYSVDLCKPEIARAGVTFLQGDCNRIEEVLPPALLRSAPHPWLFLEDAHVNTTHVLEYIHQFTEPSDYLVVEDTDSLGKEAEIAKFMAIHCRDYKVDTHYTDFFGYNACCSKDAIWRRF
jgi:cephalosporin hydroxylase